MQKKLQFVLMDASENEKGKQIIVFAGLAYIR